MANIFEVTIKNGKKIRLTGKQWKHIKQNHPEMANTLTEIEEALVNPTNVVKQDTHKFYRFIKSQKKYVVAVVRILNGDGFVITAYKTRG